MNVPVRPDSELPRDGSSQVATADQSATGIILVDHGSRRLESNQLLLRSVAAFEAASDYRVVEPAHMELAQPDLGTAFRRCVARGAKRVVVFPWFLSPGRHWDQDIPALVSAAAAEFPLVPWLVTAPFGLHPGLLTVVGDRIAHCIAAAADEPVGAAERPPDCDFCLTGSRCQFRTANPVPG